MGELWLLTSYVAYEGEQPIGVWTELPDALQWCREHGGTEVKPDISGVVHMFHLRNDGYPHGYYIRSCPLNKPLPDAAFPGR